MKTIATLGLALAVAVAGCGEDSEGVIESLAVGDDGSAVLIAGVDRQENEFRLSGAELQWLEDELAATKTYPPGVPPAQLGA